MNQKTNKLYKFSSFSFLGLMHLSVLINTQCCSRLNSFYPSPSVCFSTFSSCCNSLPVLISSPSPNSSNCINRIDSMSSGKSNNSQIPEIIKDLPVLNLFGLRLKFDGIKFFVSDYDYSISDLLEIVYNLNDSFVNINEKGYVSEKFTLIPFFTQIKDFIKSMNYKVPFDFGMNENTFTLWFNVIKANLILVINQVIKNTTFIEESELDKLSDLEMVRDKLISELDPFIRVQMQKRGISIISNTYIGFDTEYKLKNLAKNLNTLISIQSAAQNRVLIKLPLYNTYDISYVHPLTSEITRYFKPKVDE